MKIKQKRQPLLNVSLERQGLSWSLQIYNWCTVHKNHTFISLWKPGWSKEANTHHGFFSVLQGTEAVWFRRTSTCEGHCWVGAPHQRLVSSITPPQCFLYMMYCMNVWPGLCVCLPSLFGNIQEEVVKDADSVRGQQQQHVQQYSCTLDECFQLYTKEEQVTNASYSSPSLLWSLAHTRIWTQFCHCRGATLCYSKCKTKFSSSQNVCGGS